jgi:hypothetical protein
MKKSQIARALAAGLVVYVFLFAVGLPSLMAFYYGAATFAFAALMWSWLSATRVARSRLFRRRVVVAMYAANVAATVCLLAIPDALAVLVVSLVVPMVAFNGLQRMNSAVIANLPDSIADERQQAARDRAYRLAYQIVSYYVFAVAAFTVFARIPTLSNSLWPPPRSNDIAMYWLFLMPILTLPGAVLAWNQPDDLEPEPA